MILLRLALLFCPGDFRAQYSEQIYADAQTSGWARAVLDAFCAGAAMRFENAGRNVTLAARSLLKSPLHAAVIVLTIASAIGVNLGVGAAIEGLLLRPLPYEHANHLLFVEETNAGHSISYPDAQRLARRMHPYGDLALAAFDNATLQGHGPPIEVPGGLVSANYFSVLGVHPALGRFFASDLPYSPAAVISYTLWRERYGASPSALGRLLHLNGRAYTIAGVAPAGFIDPSPFGLVRRQYWVQIDPRNASQVSAANYDYNAIARIHSSVDPGTARRSLRAMLTAIGKSNPNDAASCCVRVRFLAGAVLGPIRQLLLFLYAAVCIVLIIACANVANLQISRNVLRSGEIALREALGARPRHIISQLAAETALLATLGAALGLGIAWFAVRLVGTLAQPLLPRWNDVRIDAPLLIYACLLVLLTTFAAGVLPALLRRNRSGGAALTASGRGGNLAPRRLGRWFLLTAQLALATIVVIAAGLVLNGFLALTHVEYGFEPNGLYVVQLPQLEERHAHGATNASMSDAAIVTMARTITGHLRSIGGVASVSAALSVPFWCCDRTSVDFTGHAQAANTFYDAVAPGYFHTVGIPRILGRAFTTNDRSGAPCVVAVNEAFARRYFGGVAATGHTIVWRAQRCTVVAVVADAVEEYGKAAVPILYFPIAQDPQLRLFAIRMRPPASDFAARVDAAVSKAYPALPQPAVYPVQTLIAGDAFVPRTAALIFCLLAAIALGLALAGIYAVVSWAVAQRMHEFGIRKALGARSRGLVVSITAAALAQSSLGIIAGIALAALIARNFAALLYQTSPVQPSVYFAVIALLCICVAVAAMIPALRAALADPAIALRYE